MINAKLSPALSSGRREAVMVASGCAQLALVDDAGDTRYIKIEAKAKDLVLGKRYAAVVLEDATHVFVSEKGYGTTSIGTFYPRSGRLFENVDPASGHVAAFLAAAAWINGEALPAPFVKITAESKCGHASEGGRVCGRKLEDPVSVERGIGPDCAQTPTGSKIVHALEAAKAAVAQPAPTEDPGNAAEAALAAAEGGVGYAAPEAPAPRPRPETVAPNRLMRAMDVMTDAELEGIAAEAQRILHKREFARIEAAQETAAALAGMR